MHKPMSQPLSPSALAEIRERVREAVALSLFLDFDGTLAPIVNDPGDARLAPGVRKRLEALAARNDTLVAIVSGRALADLRPRVGIASAIYAGNHGLEISGPEISGPELGGKPVSFVEPCALARLEPLRRSSSPFDGPVPQMYARTAVWVEPWLVIEVAFDRWTKAGRMRAPVYKGLRDDKDPADVVREP